MLDLISLALQKNRIGYQRIDGSKSFKERCEAIESFRTDSSYPVLLASLGSAALGLVIYCTVKEEWTLIR